MKITRPTWVTFGAIALLISAATFYHSDEPAAQILSDESGSSLSQLMIDSLAAAELDKSERFLFDEDDDSTTEVGIVYVQWYEDKPCENAERDTDIKHTRADARGFGSTLLGFTLLFTASNGLAWESAFGAIDDEMIDLVDFLYFAGHGLPGELFFSHQHDDCSAIPSECFGRWGDKDVEWMAFASCMTVEKSRSFWWHRCFDGLHLLCGYGSNCNDHPNLGSGLATRINARNTIAQSWMATAKVYHNARFFGKQKRCARVVAETIGNLDDHVFGAGTVSDDPVHDNKYSSIAVRWEGKQTPSESSQYDCTGCEVFYDPSWNGPRVLAHRNLLSRNRQEMVPVYSVQNRIVDIAYIDSILAPFCYQLGVLCSPSVEYQPEFNQYILVDGTHQLIISEESGGWEYVNTETFARPAGVPPYLPDCYEARFQARSFLSEIGPMPDDTVSLDCSWIHLGSFNDSSMAEIPEESWDMSINVPFYRKLGNRYVAGPGASCEVTLGNYNSLERVFNGGWRDIIATDSVMSLALETALENLAIGGYAATIGGLPLCDDVITVSAELGYYEGAFDESISDLQVVWIVDVICQTYSESQDTLFTSDFELILPAVHQLPDVYILSPMNGESFKSTDTVSLDGYAVENEAKDLVYEWYSDIDGYLASGQVSEVTDLTCVGNNDDPAIHTIILEVTSSDSVMSYATTTIEVALGYTCGDANGSDEVDIDDVVFLISYIFAGGSSPVPIESGDADCSGGIDIDDVVYLISYIFAFGPAPCDTDMDGIPDC